MKNIYTLFVFCRRATVYGIRGSLKYLENALTTLSMVEPERCDYRDAVIAFALVNYGIVKMNLDFEKLLQKSILNSSPMMGQLLLQYKGTGSKGKSLEARAGYAEFHSKYGPGFIHWLYADYKPKNNLANIGLEISEFIAKDKYQRGILTAAAKLPLVYFNGKNNLELKSILERSMGTLSISSHPKENICKTPIYQMFLLCLVECENPKDAENLTQAVNSSPNKGHCKIAAAVEEICWVLITRSAKVGVDPFEDSESIKRFNEPFSRTIKQNRGCPSLG